MSSVRDLYVGIRFEDDVSRELKRVDRQVDDVRDSMERLGSEANDVERDLNSMSTGFNGLDGVARDANQAERALNDLDHTNVDINVDTKELLMLQALLSASAFNKFGNSGSGAFSSLILMGTRFVGVLVLIIAGLSAVVAAAAPLVLMVGGLAASLAAAGTGAVAFGAVAIPALINIFESATKVDEIQKKIDDASTVKERVKAQGELAALYDDMSDSQRGALKELQSFKAFFKDFSKQFENPIFDAFGEGLALTKNVLTGLAPTITAVSGVVGTLISEMNNSVIGGGLTDFFNWLSTNAATSLYNFAHIMGNVMGGVFSLLQAFAPYGAMMEQGLLSLTEKFQTWSEGFASSNGFQTFVNYAMQNGPTLLGIIGNIWNIFTQLITDLAPLGTTILSGIQSFTSLINDNWPAIRETVIGLGAAVVTFAAAMTGLQVIGVVNALMTAYRAGTLLATAAQLGLNAAMWLSPTTWVIAGIAALVGIGIVLYRNWDTIKSKAIELWNKMGALKGVVLGLLGPFGAIVGAGISVYQNWDTIKEKAVSAFGVVKGWIDKVKGAWDGFKSAISSFKMPSIKLPSLPSWLGGGGSKADGSHATGLARVPFDNYKANVHKDEAILTAKQSNALRNAGILSENGDGTPSLNMGGGSVQTSSVQPAGSTIQYNPSVVIEIGGSNASAA